jgi:hypothetical protein
MKSGPTESLRTKRDLIEYLLLIAFAILCSSFVFLHKEDAKTKSAVEYNPGSIRASSHASQ